MFQPGKQSERKREGEREREQARESVREGEEQTIKRRHNYLHLLPRLSMTTGATAANAIVPLALRHCKAL